MHGKKGNNYQLKITYYILGTSDYLLKNTSNLFHVVFGAFPTEGF